MVTIIFSRLNVSKICIVLSLTLCIVLGLASKNYAYTYQTLELESPLPVRIDPYTGLVTEHGTLVLDKNLTLKTNNDNEGIIDIGYYAEFPTGVEFPYTGYQPTVPLIPQHVYLLRLPYLIAQKPQDYDYAIIQLMPDNQLAYQFVSSQELDASSLYSVQTELVTRDVTKPRLLAYTTVDSLPADGQTETKITARITDGFGVPLANQQIQFEQIKGSGTLVVEGSTTDDRGIATARYIAGKVAKTTQIRVSDPKTGNHTDVNIALAISSHLTFKLVSPQEYISRPVSIGAEIPFLLSLSVFPDKIPADGMTTCKITATLINKETLQPVVGMPLVFSIINGGGELTVINTSTDMLGQAFSYYRSSLRPGNVKIAVREPITGLTSEADITIVEAGPASIKLTFVDKEGKELEGGTILPADGITSVTLKALVLDLANLPVPNVVVNFSLMDNNGRLERLQVITGADGVATNTYYCGNMIGEETITAFVSSKLYEQKSLANEK